MQHHVDLATPRSPGLERTESRFTNLLPSLDRPEKPFWSSFVHALLATALFRCYHIILFFTAWGTIVTLVNQQKIYALNFQPTLLTVIGTVLGFVISYRREQFWKYLINVVLTMQFRTTSSFERYNEGRRLWSQIIMQSRTFARTIWFHVPDILPTPLPEDQGRSPDERTARSLVEKKTVVNLIEGFAVSVKHYLRGEEGIFYEDLWPLVKFLPAYALPNSLPSAQFSDTDEKQPNSTSSSREPPSGPHLPLHNDSSIHKRPANISVPPPSTAVSHGQPQHISLAPPTPRGSTRPPEEPNLLPSHIPPQFSYFDVFPFSLLVKLLTKRGKEVKGRKAARLRARMVRGKRGKIVSHNVPLEITLYLSSYIAALQRRKAIDVPTTNLLIGSLSGLVDALTGLERILTTPIPFSYSIHLWTVTTIYCLALPLQIWKTLGWITIPATSILTFIFFGFLVAGEEIENPFGYDKNDLNMDHFIHAIIRPELMAITSIPTPDPADWAFSSLNDLLFDAHNLPTDRNASRIIERGTPDEWVSRGVGQMREALSRGMERTGLT